MSDPMEIWKQRAHERSLAAASRKRLTRFNAVATAEAEKREQLYSACCVHHEHHHSSSCYQHVPDDDDDEQEEETTDTTASGNSSIATTDVVEAVSDFNVHKRRPDHHVVVGGVDDRTSTCLEVSQATASVTPTMLLRSAMLSRKISAHRQELLERKQKKKVHQQQQEEEEEVNSIRRHQQPEAIIVERRTQKKTKKQATVVTGDSSFSAVSFRVRSENGQQQKIYHDGCNHNDGDDAATSCSRPATPHPRAPLKPVPVVAISLRGDEFACSARGRKKDGIVI